MGSASVLNSYFDKIHQYRVDGQMEGVDESAFIFIDDDWADSQTTLDFDLIYQTVDNVSNDSTHDTYVTRLTGIGAEFVSQWVHAYPGAMMIGGQGSGTVSTSDIESNNFKASFINLWNCSACRYTDENMGMTYVTKTDYGLATIGTTKPGSTLNQELFNTYLADGLCWGEAFRKWFNEYGSTNDSWHQGIVIMGDPLLTVSGDAREDLRRQSSYPKEYSPEVLEKWKRTMREFNSGHKVGTFEQYRAAHPQFFR
jgi:hypothetical protein